MRFDRKLPKKLTIMELSGDFRNLHSIYDAKIGDPTGNQYELSTFTKDSKLCENLFHLITHKKILPPKILSRERNKRVRSAKKEYGSLFTNEMKDTIHTEVEFDLLSRAFIDRIVCRCYIYSTSPSTVILLLESTSESVKASLRKKLREIGIITKEHNSFGISFIRKTIIVPTKNIKLGDSIVFKGVSTKTDKRIMTLKNYDIDFGIIAKQAQDDMQVDRLAVSFYDDCGEEPILSCMVDSDCNFLAINFLVDFSVDASDSYHESVVHSSVIYNAFAKILTIMQHPLQGSLHT